LDDNAEFTDLPWKNPLHDHPDDVRFWYKAKGQASDGGECSWEGGFNAKNLGCAMSVVKIRSLHWKSKEIYWIAIFEVDDTGCIELDPSLWQNFSSHCVSPKEMKLELTGPSHPIKQGPRWETPAEIKDSNGLRERQRKATDAYNARIDAANALAFEKSETAKAEQDAVGLFYEKESLVFKEPELKLPITFSTLTLKETKDATASNDRG